MLSVNQPIFVALSQAPMPYSFDWAVLDGPSYNDFGHKETSDGKVVTGTYYVALPDGRRQIVTYKADEYGYVADVMNQATTTLDTRKPATAKLLTEPTMSSYPTVANKWSPTRPTITVTSPM